MREFLLVVHLQAKVVSLLIGANQKQLKELKIIYKKVEVQPSCELRVRFNFQYSSCISRLIFIQALNEKETTFYLSLFLSKVMFMQNNSDNEGLELKQFKQ